MRGAVRLQESVGLDVISDGEMRRLNFQDSFGAAVEGFDASRSTMQEHTSGASKGGTALRRWEVRGCTRRARRSRTAGRSRRGCKLARNVPLEEYEFVAGVAKTPAKVSLIGPDRISQRFDHENSKARLQGHGRFHGRRGRDRARDRREPGRRPAAATSTSTRRATPPMSTSRRWSRCARAARTRWRISPARSRPNPR